MSSFVWKARDVGMGSRGEIRSHNPAAAGPWVQIPPPQPILSKGLETHYSVLHLSFLCDKRLLCCNRDIMVLSCLCHMNDYPIKTPRQLGAVLQGYRRNQKLTQHDVGAKVGLAQNVVSLLEAAPERASLGRIFKLLSALDLELVVRPRGAEVRRSEW